jgi:hypothetical protein
LVDNLTPDQRSKYDKEQAAYERWGKDNLFDPIAFRDPPIMPVHEEIESRTNASGLSDREEQHKMADAASPW